MQADQAQIDAQKLNLTYCKIVSPVTGRVGLRQVDPGNYVQTSDPNGIVVVTQLQPISVIFTLPEDKLAGGDATGAGRRHTAGNGLSTAPARQSLPRESSTLSTTRSIPTTGTVKLRALFDNEQEILFPNQFVNIKLLVDTLHDTDDRPELGDPARRTRHFCLCRQAGPHGRASKR